jgi:hypothetical protein
MKSADLWRKFGANIFKNTPFGANWRKFFDTLHYILPLKNRYKKPLEASHIKGFQRYINVYFYIMATNGSLYVGIHKSFNTSTSNV